MKTIKSSDIDTLVSSAIAKAQDAFTGEGDKGAAMGELLDLAVVKSELIKLEKAGEDVPGSVMLSPGIGAIQFTAEQTTEIGKSVAAFKSAYEGGDAATVETTASELLKFVAAKIDDTTEADPAIEAPAQPAPVSTQAPTEAAPTEAAPTSEGAAPLEKSDKGNIWAKDMSAEFAQEEVKRQEATAVANFQSQQAILKSVKPSKFSWNNVKDGNHEG